MPNIITAVTLIDSTRRGRVLLNGQFDGASGQESQSIKINTWGLSGALSTAANGTQLLAGNGSPRSAYNIAISRIEYTIAPGGMVNLAWQGTTNTQFATLFGSGELEVASRGIDFTLDPSLGVGGAPGHTGNVVLTTLGLGANSGYTIMIDYKKDPKAFDQGQIARPKDFNIILATGNNV
jgi:hypothetical protein